MNVKIKTSLQRKEELNMLISSDMIGKIINDEIHNTNFWNETIKHVSNPDKMKNF